MSDHDHGNDERGSQLRDNPPDPPGSTDVCFFCGDEDDTVSGFYRPGTDEVVGVCDDFACQEAKKLVEDSYAPPGSDRAPAGMGRATGVDDPVPDAEYGDRF